MSEPLSAPSPRKHSTPNERADALRRVKFIFAIPLLSLCFMMLGHDFDRSLLLDEGFNVDDDEMQERVEEGMVRFRLAFLGIGAIGIALLVAPGGSRLTLRPALAISVLLLVAWSFGSIVWSHDPSLTLRRLVTLTCSFVGMLGIARAFRAIDLCLFGFLFTLSMAFLGIFAEIVLGTFQPWNFDYRFAGLVHPNTQGIELSVVILTGIALSSVYPKWRTPIFCIVAAAFVGLMLTKSRTSAACCIVALVSLWLVNTSPRTKLISAMSVLLVCGMFAIALLAFGIDDSDRLTNALSMGRDDDNSSLTGRIPIWIALWDDVMKRPVAGAGFNTYFDEETLAYLSQQHEWAVPNAHNAFIEQLLNLGFVGLFLMITVVVVALSIISKPTIRALDPAYGVFFALIIMGLLNAGFESTMVVNFFFPPCLIAGGICRLAFFEDGASASWIASDHREQAYSEMRPAWTS